MVGWSLCNLFFFIPIVKDFVIKSSGAKAKTNNTELIKFVDICPHNLPFPIRHLSAICRTFVGHLSFCLSSARMSDCPLSINLPGYIMSDERHLAIL